VAKSEKANSQLALNGHLRLVTPVIEDRMPIEYVQNYVESLRGYTQVTAKVFWVFFLVRYQDQVKLRKLVYFIGKKHPGILEEVDALMDCTELSPKEAFFFFI